MTAVCLFPKRLLKLVGGAEIPDDEDKLDKCLGINGSGEGFGGGEAGGAPTFIGQCAGSGARDIYGS